MSPELVSRSPDLARLRDEHFEVQIVEDHLVVTHIPYVTTGKTIAYGTLVSVLDVNVDVTMKPNDHVIFWSGPMPCYQDGTPMKALEHQVGDQTLGKTLLIKRSFSNKPRPTGYNDYYEKITRYVEMISAPARSIDPSVSAQTNTVVENPADESVFLYRDTNSTRAHIKAIADKLAPEKVGIIGLGGTGSYVLDCVAKTPAADIHLFDADIYSQHNAFRSPGGASILDLKAKALKVEHWARVYSNMRRSIHPYPGFITPANLEKLNGLTFVFLCIDDGPPKQPIVDFLEAHGISFIDVGMGVTAKEGALSAIVRVTTSTLKRRDHFRKRVSFNEEPEGEYATNIQIAELNMLNAALAVIKWKKLRGFYHDFENENHSAYGLDTNQLENDDGDT